MHGATIRFIVDYNLCKYWRPSKGFANKYSLVPKLLVRGQLKCDGTHAENRCHLSRETDRVHLNRPGAVSSVDYWQPSCAPSAVVMLDTPCSKVV